MQQLDPHPSSTTEQVRVAGELTLLQSSQPFVKFHRIEDRELEMMLNTSAPLAFGVSTTALGALLGLAPAMIPIIVKASASGILDVSDTFVIVLTAVCGTTAIIMGIRARRNWISAKTILKDIRGRPSVPL